MNVADNYFKPVLHHAVQQWKFAAARELPEEEKRLSKILKKSVASVRTEKRERRQSLERLIDLLLDAGAQLEGRGLVGETPLHIAAEADDVDMARRLVARGADVNCLNDHGNSPLACRRAACACAGAGGKSGEAWAAAGLSLAARLRIVRSIAIGQMVGLVARIWNQMGRLTCKHQPMHQPLRRRMVASNGLIIRSFGRANE